MRLIFIFTLLIAMQAHAHEHGPIAPDGWDGSFAPKLPTGQPCCLPAKLNGTNLTGGAIILVSSNKKSFGIFALTYTPPLKEHWQLLEQHPMSVLSNYKVFIEPPGRFPYASIKVCTGNSKCYFYYTSSAKSLLKKSSGVKHVH